MKVKVLIDNESRSSEILKEHGMSILIELQDKTILFDTGKTDAFIRNAKQMNVDLKKVNMTVISHGHYDHAGGLNALLSINQTTKVFVRLSAFRYRESQRPDKSYHYIGMSESLRVNEQFIDPSETLKINDHLTLFSNVFGNKLMPSMNLTLFQTQKGVRSLDDFSDEQNLLIEDNGKVILISGCSHRGIVNIIEKAESIVKKNIDIVIGGFHLYNFSAKTMENENNLFELSTFMRKRNTMFYTMHCTGLIPFQILKKYLGSKIEYLRAGDEITI